MALLVRSREHRPIADQPFEVVERKGIGHPDTICDAVAEHVSRRLCRYYLEHFDRVLHHNVDKVLLCGGSARPVFGGGEVLAPIEIFLAGRATSQVGDKPIPVAELAIEACREWLKQHLPELDVERDVRIQSRIRPGSQSLTELFMRGATVPFANDTSCGVGFAPLTDLERVVLAVEQRLNDPTVKRAHPELGSDVKVMGVRRDQRIELTVACAIISGHVSDLSDYLAATELVNSLVRAEAELVTRLAVNVIVNAEDVPERGELFLTVTGTSAEAGDDGEVGRGNRANGLITPYRPMTLEAAAGKNPVNHVGKLYNLVARQTAERLVQQLPDVHDASCVLVSRIGEPIDEPQAADIELGVDDPSRIQSLTPRVIEIARAVLRDLPQIQRLLVAGTLDVF
ncbi:MAG TPA: methionine adenosyltransferase [Polyangiaceae bacterium]|nr:methionine adenosyltransferase [Polyangiaceae bacterium]